MKASELRAAIEHTNKFHPFDVDDLRVVVETHNGGCPTWHMAEVSCAHKGFDWTASLFIVRPIEPLVVVHDLLDKRLADFARERLDFIKASYAKSCFSYIPKARESAWLDGFEEGVKAHVTACKEVTP